MSSTDELNKMDINAVIDAIWHTSSVLMNDDEHEMETNDRVHLIGVIDGLSAVLARWYHIR